MTMVMKFNKSNYNQKTIANFQEVLSEGHTSGDGKYTRLCSKFLEEKTGAKSTLITHSCTAALEMAAIMLDAKPDDEVIMPSFTFASTANAFVLRGIKPVFVDIRHDNCNIDESLIEQAITSKTKAIVPVHYAGVACEIMSNCKSLSLQHSHTQQPQQPKLILRIWNFSHNHKQQIFSTFSPTKTPNKPNSSHNQNPIYPPKITST